MTTTHKNYGADCRIIDALGYANDVAVGVLIGLGRHDLADRLAAAIEDEKRRAEDFAALTGDWTGLDAAIDDQAAAKETAAKARLSAAQTALNTVKNEVAAIRETMLNALPEGVWARDYLGL